MFGLGIYTRMAAALVVALVLAAGGWKAYSAGKKTVQAQWNAEKLVQATEAAQASEARRMKEKALSFTNEGIANAYVKEKSRLVAAARAADGRLRDFQAASDSAARERTAAASGVDEPYRAIASQCATALAGLDEYAQGVAAKARALQDYTREMRLIN